jgi:hypothetical protein
MMQEPCENVAEVPTELRDLVPGFLENKRIEMESVAAALQRQDFKQIRIWGHNMLGCGVGYGFVQISEFGRKMEIAALAQDVGAISDCARQVCTFLSNVKIVYR